MNLDAPLAPSHEEAATGVVVACSAQTVRVAIDGGAAPLARLLSRWPHFLRLDKGFPETPFRRQLHAVRDVADIVREGGGRFLSSGDGHGGQGDVGVFPEAGIAGLWGSVGGALVLVGARKIPVAHRLFFRPEVPNEFVH